MGRCAGKYWQFFVDLIKTVDLILIKKYMKLAQIRNKSTRIYSNYKRTILFREPVSWKTKWKLSSRKSCASHTNISRRRRKSKRTRKKLNWTKHFRIWFQTSLKWVIEFRFQFSKMVYFCSVNFCLRRFWTSIHRETKKKAPMLTLTRSVRESVPLLKHPPDR